MIALAGVDGLWYTRRMSLHRRAFVRQLALGVAAAGAGCATTSGAAGPLIVDTHLHLWSLDVRRPPWLSGVADVLRKNYGLDEYRSATAGLNIRSVYMEVDVAESDLVGEADSILGLASTGRSPVRGAVIGGRPASPGFAEYLGRYRGNVHFKGVRQVLHVESTPAGYCLQPEFVRGVRMLGAMGRRFDLCMRAPELRDGLRLTEQCPETSFVLDHCGNPDLKSFRPLRAGETAPTHTADDWKRSIEALAGRPNVICKISGVAAGLKAGGGAEDLAPAVNFCLDAFGPDRVVFGGDWPVCLLGATYQKWVEMLREIVASRPAEHQTKLWSANAIRLYGLAGRV